MKIRIDLDFNPSGRDKVQDWIREEWGDDHVAKIGTMGTFKLKGLTRRFFKLTTPEDERAQGAHFALMKDILDRIPEPSSGAEATLKEMVDGNPRKGYKPQQFLKTDHKYSKWYAFAVAMEGMVEKLGVHAAGLVISNDPIYNTVPTYKTSKFERITQWDKDLVEGHGLLKLDLLVIANLDILQMVVRLIEERHQKKYDIYNIPDGDVNAYKILGEGLLTGVFQFEESDVIKNATVEAKPSSIPNLSDLSSLVRPGPAKAGYLDMYLKDEQDPDLYPGIRELWSATKGVLVYQEQLMATFVKFAGYSEEESDAIRRIVGKKKPEKLAVLKPDVMTRLQAYGGLSKQQALHFWEVVIGCADYLFNKSHGIAYSYISYICAYFKANYPVEFFCALMTVRGASMQPKDWAEKVNEYIDEAAHFGITISAPSVQTSNMGFTIHSDTEIYFGFSGIRSVGKVAARSLMAARGKTKFIDVQDFLSRINRNKLNNKAFDSLVKAGAFDKMGYRRRDLLKESNNMYEYFKKLEAYQLCKIEIAQRQLENEKLVPLIEQRNELRKIQKRKTGRDLTPEELVFLEETKGLRKKVALKAKSLPEWPELTRHKQVEVSMDEIMVQQEYLGCFIGVHPCSLLYPDAARLKDAYQGMDYMFSGFVNSKKEFRTRKGSQLMAVLDIGDGTGSARVVIFPRTYAMLKDKPDTGDIIQVFGKVDKQVPTVEILANTIQIHRS